MFLLTLEVIHSHSFKQLLFVSFQPFLGIFNTFGFCNVSKTNDRRAHLSDTVVNTPSTVRLTVYTLYACGTWITGRLTATAAAATATLASFFGRTVVVSTTYSTMRMHRRNEIGDGGNLRRRRRPMEGGCIII